MYNKRVFIIQIVTKGGTAKTACEIFDFFFFGESEKTWGKKVNKKKVTQESILKKQGKSNKNKLL